MARASGLRALTPTHTHIHTQAQPVHSFLFNWIRPLRLSGCECIIRYTRNPSISILAVFLLIVPIIFKCWTHWTSRHLIIIIMSFTQAMKAVIKRTSTAALEAHRRATRAAHSDSVDSQDPELVVCERYEMQNDRVEVPWIQWQVFPLPRQPVIVIKLDQVICNNRVMNKDNDHFHFRR